MVKKLPFLACLLMVGPAEAQVRPFVFTVTTGPSGAAAGPDTRPWTTYYDAGYGERTAEPFGYDGVEQRFGVQGRLGAGFSPWSRRPRDRRRRHPQQPAGRVAQGRSGLDVRRAPRRRPRGPTRVGGEGWLQNVGRGLRLGVEAVGEDLEGLWEAEEAEGGAKLYAGPAVHWAAPAGRLWVSAGGGPIVYATRSGRSSPAPRPLDAAGNGFTMRVSVGYTF